MRQPQPFPACLGGIQTEVSVNTTKYQVSNVNKFTNLCECTKYITTIKKNNLTKDKFFITEKEGCYLATANNITEW